jgi:biotin synthase
MLSLEGEEDLKALFKRAYEIKKREVGVKAYFRGLIELSNICEKDCYYCGIRKSNKEVKRFLMGEEEIIETAKWVYEQNYGSLVLQAGEMKSPKFTEMIERVLKAVREQTDNKLRVTLSLGEQDEATYARWLAAGAHRYLLRIETSNKDLYKRLHPEDHNIDVRLEALGALRRTGYQVGTGVMIGLPYQSIEDLADDILFFQERDIDMIGMGPYIPHHDTPLPGLVEGDFDYDPERQLNLGLKMIAATRIFLQDVNIAATTALQALHPKGREKGLEAGANVIMPNATNTKYRESYQLYDGKPCLDENSGQCRGCLQHRVEFIGETIGFDEWGDSPHYVKRTAGKK